MRSALLLPICLAALTGCLCPRSERTRPELDGRVVDGQGVALPDATLDLCEEDANCRRVELSNEGTFHQVPTDETSVGCCLTSPPTSRRFRLHAEHAGMLPLDQPAEGTHELKLVPRTMTPEQAAAAIVVAHRDTGVARVLASGWSEVVTAVPEAKLHTPSTELQRERIVHDVEASGLLTTPGTDLDCRSAIAQLVTSSGGALVIRYGTRWFFVSDPPAYSPLKRLPELVGPAQLIQASDDAPAATALLQGNADVVAQHLCGAAVGGKGGVAMR